MNVHAQQTELDWGCGVKVVGNFCNYGSGYNKENLSNPDNFYSGTGFFISSFVNDALCRDAYQTIKEKFEITYQSPVKTNSHSGNRFFFIVYRKRKN